MLAFPVVLWCNAGGAVAHRSEEGVALGNRWRQSQTTGGHGCLDFPPCVRRASTLLRVAAGLSSSEGGRAYQASRALLARTVARGVVASCSSARLCLPAFTCSFATHTHTLARGVLVSSFRRIPGLAAFSGSHESHDTPSRPRRLPRLEPLSYEGLACEGAWRSHGVCRRGLRGLRGRCDELGGGRSRTAAGTSCGHGGPRTSARPSLRAAHGAVPSMSGRLFQHPCTQ